MMWIKVYVLRTVFPSSGRRNIVFTVCGLADNAKFCLFISSSFM
jgi:hypothetical protein